VAEVVREEPDRLILVLFQNAPWQQVTADKPYHFIHADSCRIQAVIDCGSYRIFPPPREAVFASRYSLLLNGNFD
jgi:hypothetical protein